MANYKIASLSLIPSKKTASISEVFIAQTDSEKENLAGKIFAIFEIEADKIISQKIIGFLLQKINENYYQSDKMILREKVYSLKPEHIFEAALSKTNKQYNQFLENEKISINLSNINITIGLIFNDELHFANSGKNQVLLIHRLEAKNNGQNTNQEYKLLNITKQTSDDKENHKKHELFSNIINGKIPPHGSIFITNEAIPEYLSKKQIIETITALPPLSAAEQIKNVLSQINFYLSFVGIIIKNNENYASEGAVSVQAPISTKDSVHSLNVTEENTEKILSPSGVFKLQSWFRNPFKDFTLKKSDRRLYPNISIKDNIYSKKQSLLVFNFPKIINFLKNIWSSVLNVSFFAFRSLLNKKGVVSDLKNIPQSGYSRFKNFLGNLKKLSLRNVLLLLVALFAIVTVIININISKNRQKEIAEENSYRQTIAEIEKKQNQIEANLLYNDNKSAQKLFSEMELLLNSLPQITPEQKNTFLSLSGKLAGQLNEVRKITLMDKAATVAELDKINSQAEARNIFFLSTTNNLYVADSKQKSIYIVDTVKKSVTTAARLEDPISNLEYPTSLDNNSLLYLNDTGVIGFQAKNSLFSNLKIDYQGSISDISGAGTYNNRLYLLNKGKNQIVRYALSGDSFDNSFNWLNEKIDLRNAINLAIDGSVYILFNDGSVQKFLRSQKAEFALESIDPPLSSPTKIMVSETSDFIYILEPKGKRLAVFNKKGGFILQYKTDKFNDLKDFTVDEKGKIIYFLNSNDVFSFPAEHFK